MMKSRFVFAIFLVAACASLARAGGLDGLENFVKTAKSGRADFTQVVTLPAKQGQTARTRTSSGSFEFLRPNRFRFVYRKPFEQTVVADGQSVWLYDVDLNQVTVRKQAAALGSTPAAIIASAPDLKTLSADFTLSDAPAQDGLEWALAVPKSRDSGLQSVRIGFRGDELARLEILDGFGQRSVLSFTGLQVNSAPDASVFQFKPPSGADVLRQ